MPSLSEQARAEFTRNCVWYGSLDRAQAILADHPEIARADIYMAALLGDDAAVRAFIGADPSSATAKGGALGWDALTYLCFSRYLQHDAARSEAFVRAATALLDAGASANTGFRDENHRPEPEWESVLYGASGVAHHAPMTRLLLERGAEPNDEETPYHAPETRDNAALEVLLDSGKLTHESLTVMLVRKADWHDPEGARLILAKGIDPNRPTRHGWSPLHHAVMRDNRIEMVELLLEHGADPTMVAQGRSAYALAVRRGRGDLLRLFASRGVPDVLQGSDRLLAACALGDASAAFAIAEGSPLALEMLRAHGGQLLAEFAGNGNAEGVTLLLDLGVSAGAKFTQGDGYWGVAPDSTALHVAAWRLQPATVQRLIERGAPVNARDGNGRTALMLAVKACTDSYWSHRRTTEPARVLLAAGAATDGVMRPCGWEEMNTLLADHGDSATTARERDVSAG